MKRTTELSNSTNGLRLGIVGGSLRPLRLITDVDAIKAAEIAKIGNNPKVERFGTGKDSGCVIITDGLKNRSLKIYYSGSNTKLTHNGFEVIEYCFDVYDFLRSIGYEWQ